MIGYQKILGFPSDQKKSVHTEMFLALIQCFTSLKITLLCAQTKLKTTILKFIQTGTTFQSINKLICLYAVKIKVNIICAQTCAHVPKLVFRSDLL